MRPPITPIVVIVCAIVVGASTTHAAPLDLDKPHDPLVYSDFLEVDYDPNGGPGGTTGKLHAYSSLFSPYIAYTDATTDVYLSDGAFDLTVIINRSTGAPVSGSILVTGDLDGSNVVTLFESATIELFGFADDDLFEVTFRQENDTAMASAGDELGVILDARDLAYDLGGGSISLPAFDQGAFSGDGFAMADAFYMPEPSMTVLLGLASVGILWRRRRYAGVS